MSSIDSCFPVLAHDLELRYSIQSYKYSMICDLSHLPQSEPSLHPNDLSKMLKSMLSHSWSPSDLRKHLHKNTMLVILQLREVK